MSVSTTIYPPPETEQFEENGKLSPEEFKRAGDKLTEVCTGWKWMPSLNPAYTSKYLDEKKQYLILEKVQCKKRVGNVEQGEEQKITSEDGEEVIVLHSNQTKEEVAKE